MTLNEFKAWFEGFSEGIDKVPTEEQWNKVVDKVKQLNHVAKEYNSDATRNFWNPTIWNPTRSLTLGVSN